MKYVPLFSLSVKHSFYADQRCADFDIVTTGSTVQMLKNQRCVLKEIPDGVRVLLAVDHQNVPFIPLDGERVFSFQMHLRNPDFALFTDLSQMPAPLVFTNADNANVLQLTAVARRAYASERFAVQQPDASAQLTLSGKPSAGLQARDFALTGLGNVSAPQAYDTAAKIITVNTSSVAANTVFAVTYECVPQPPRGVFAEIEVHHQGTNAKHYEIAFSAKQAFWRFYVVASPNAAPFSIKDLDAAPIVFGTATNLNTQPDAADKIAVSLAEKFPDKQRYRIVSNARVACRQQVRAALQLLQNNTPAIKQLSNPALHNTVLVNQEGASQNEVALYQIIRAQ